jgi:sugar phosphate isomerase/epimerase
MNPGINLEFARSDGLGLEEALRRAACAGYRFVEPYVYAPVSLSVNSHLELRTAALYHHVHAEETDLRGLDRLRRQLGLAFSALDAHAALLAPPIGVPYLRRAIRVAAELECPIVMSDEGPVPDDWLPLDRAMDVLSISLEAIFPAAASCGVKFALELHNALTARPDLLARLTRRFGPEVLGVNFDTGNAFLAGNDPVEYLRGIAGRVVHVHLKDIPASMLPDRGRVTGTRVGVAAGDGVLDLPGIVGVLAAAGYRGVLSVECDTLAQALRSLKYLERLREVDHGR